MENEAIIKKAFELAVKTRENAYAPYSNFKVGSTLKFKGIDELFSGCNVENVSFGGTICAERTALTSGVAKYSKQELEFVVVVTDRDPPVTPCGICLQMIIEFAQEDTPIYIGNTEKIVKKYKLKDLFPNGFNDFS